ncbi:MAG: RagB/SusD family nutrient uptake outer membrane protein [Cyclobacteriaceae bacterium]
MKKYKYIITLLAMFSTIWACNEDNLEKVDPNNLSPETFFKTATQVESAVNAVYANLQTRGLYTRHLYFAMDQMGRDAIVNPHQEADKQEYYKWTFGSGHGGIGAYYEACMKGINKCNFYIGNKESVDALDASVLSQDLKDKYLGEAKFMRAYYLFLLVSRFGGVPLITEIPDGPEGFTRSTAAQVYTQIETDLTEAIPLLRAKADEENGRSTKGAAIGMLGKVYLFQNKHQQALDQFELLGSMGYELEDEYFENFTEENEFGIESIFEVQYNASLGSSANWNSQTSGEGANESSFRAKEYGFNDWQNNSPHPELIDAFEAGDGRFSDTFYILGDKFGPGDSETVTTVELTVDGILREAGSKKFHRYYKVVNEDTESGVNHKVLRYADVLLMMAECENEVGTQATAVGYINEVRTRPSTGLAALPTTLTKSEVFDAIVQERRVELAYEQKRFDDLVRWDLAAAALDSEDHPGTDPSFKFVAGKHELWPIPEREFNSNSNMDPVADQNPGY